MELLSVGFEETCFEERDLLWGFFIYVFFKFSGGVQPLKHAPITEPSQERKSSLHSSIFNNLQIKITFSRFR